MPTTSADFLTSALAALLASPGPADRPRRRIFPGDPAQVSYARRFVQQALAAHGAATDAALLTSELATNAIQHTATGQGGTFEVVVCQRPATVRIAVLDGGSLAIPTPTPDQRLHISGRGLTLVDALARQWGQQGNQHGRAVWFELDAQ
jgi:anti-sigma regulatory factor (Ser/Thr protein kinase)